MFIHPYFTLSGLTNCIVLYKNYIKQMNDKTKKKRRAVYDNWQ